MIKNPNILLIGGTGRNVGKTSLVCEVIDHFSKKYDIVGLKITNHFHAGQTDTFNLLEEINPNGKKDSSRMLKAGASKVYYVESDADNLGAAYTTFYGKIKPNQVIVCESNGLSEIIKPGAYLLVDRDNNRKKKASAQKAFKRANAVVEMKDGKFRQVLERLALGNEGWVWK